MRIKSETVVKALIITNLIALILVTFFHIAKVEASPVVTCDALSQEGLSNRQVEVLHQAFQAGAPKDMSYSLAAIAWKESSAGRYLMNLQDPSAGVFMVTIENAIGYLKWKDTPFNRNRMAQLLMEDFDLAAEFAMINLQFWVDQYGNDWRTIWKRYNGGYSDSERSVKYSRDIARKISVIAECDW